MLVIKKHGLSNLVFLLLAGALFLSGCTPPGPRALLKGEKLIREGKYEPAVEQLQKAVALLPKNAQAWNFLGLAYQGGNQNAQAIKAYQQALALDHKLAAVRFNLGCAYLDENEVAQAVEQLTSYTLVEPRSLEGQLKLGAAQLRARRVDYAEKAFRAVLELQPRNAEALNGLGMAQILRRRATDALSFFNQALVNTPDYGPALLNAAVVLHQSMNNRPAALQKYKQYLALKPRQENWAAVSAVASQLEAELNPVPVPPAPVAVAPVLPPKTNLTAPHPPEVVARLTASNPPPAIVAVNTRTNSPPKTNIAKPPALAAIVSNVPAPARTSTAPALTRLVPTNKPADLEVTRVTDELVIKAPQDVGASTGNNGSRTGPAPVVTSTKAATNNEDKKGFLSRLNPFVSRKTGPSPITVVVQSNEVREIKSADLTESSVPAPAAPLPRYGYLSPAQPASGNRKEAEPFFLSGVKAQQAWQWPQAISEYQKAVQLDPAYFEAYYNQGLAAYQMANWKAALPAFEYALAVKADSADARYNFALSLKQANYLVDAAAEFTSILRTRPNETRAHYSLATLYSQKLNQPALAREHYEKVLENDPWHPKAAEIRSWLATHP